MNIESIMEFVNQSRKNSAGNLTIGKMIERLKKFNKDANFLLSDGSYLNNSFDSYRGYYEDMYIEISTIKNETTINTVSELLCLLNRAKEEGEMIGYKGGNFSIDDSTILWLDTYGNCDSIYPCEIINFENNALIIVKEED